MGGGAKACYGADFLNGFVGAQKIFHTLLTLGFQSVFIGSTAGLFLKQHIKIRLADITSLRVLGYRTVEVA